MSAIFILARMTFVQAIRRRIVLTGLLLGICFLAVFSIGFHMINTSSFVPQSPVEGTGIQNIIDTEKSSGLFLAGLYAVTFLGIAMAALLGADTLAGEINSGTIQVIVTKPIRRSDVVFGKWLGFAGLLGLYLLLTGRRDDPEHPAAVRVRGSPSVRRIGVDLHGKPAGHDHRDGLLQPVLCIGHRRGGFRPVRAWHSSAAGSNRSAQYSTARRQSRSAS